MAPVPITDDHPGSSICPARSLERDGDLWRLVDADSWRASPPHLMRAAILAEASLRTMMASFKSSHLSVISGVRCFAAWADEHRPGTPHLPASNDDLRLWSSYF